jgi:hypothetical protein
MSKTSQLTDTDEGERPVDEGYEKYLPVRVGCLSCVSSKIGLIVSVVLGPPSKVTYHVQSKSGLAGNSDIDTADPSPREGRTSQGSPTGQNGSSATGSLDRPSE